MSNNIYSVGQINTYIKHMFNEDFLLNNVNIKGEVSNCKYHGKGHIYFTIKDDIGSMSAVMFAGNRGGLDFKLSDGQQIVATGKVTVYERDGKYQLYASKIVLDGAGDLFKQYEQLKNELEDMGMFSPLYKKPIPKYVKTLGVVTASTGAAIQDIINISKRRNPYINIVLYPSLVQGENAAPSIVKGIKKLEEYGVDLMIVGRGGGSIEDLWAFNERIVAEAVFDCSVPIISAVGHETDYTIIDFVSDLRAPTPSAAAELAVYDINAVIADVAVKKDNLDGIMMNKINTLNHKIQTYNTRLKYLSPLNRIQLKKNALTNINIRLERNIHNILTRDKQKLAILAEKLNGLSPLTKLSSGYAYVEDDNCKSVKTVNDVKIGQNINIYLKDGILNANITNVDNSLHFIEYGDNYE